MCDILTDLKKHEELMGRLSYLNASVKLSLLYTYNFYMIDHSA